MHAFFLTQRKLNGYCSQMQEQHVLEAHHCYPNIGIRIASGMNSLMIFLLKTMYCSLLGSTLFYYALNIKLKENSVHMLQNLILHTFGELLSKVCSIKQLSMYYDSNKLNITFCKLSQFICYIEVWHSQPKIPPNVTQIFKISKLSI